MKTPDLPLLLSPGSPLPSSPPAAAAQTQVDAGGLPAADPHSAENSVVVPAHRCAVGEDAVVYRTPVVGGGGVDTGHLPVDGDGYP